MDKDEGYAHEFEPEFDPPSNTEEGNPEHMHDGQKAIFLGTMLLGTCLTWDPDASIDEDEDGNLVTTVRVDPDMFEIAQRCFIRENEKAPDDANTELYVGYAFDGEGNMYIRWDVKNPLGIAGVGSRFGKERSDTREENGSG